MFARREEHDLRDGEVDAERATFVDVRTFPEYCVLFLFEILEMLFSMVWMETTIIHICRLFKYKK